MCQFGFKYLTEILDTCCQNRKFYPEGNEVDVKIFLLVYSVLEIYYFSYSMKMKTSTFVCLLSNTQDDIGETGDGGKFDKIKDKVRLEQLQHEIRALQVCSFVLTQPAITCSKLTIEKLEQGVKYIRG